MKKKYLLLLILPALALIFILAFYRLLPPQIPLLFGLAESESQLVDKIYFFAVPVVGAAIIALNIFIAMRQKSKLSVKFIYYASLLLNIILLVGVIKIIFLVGFF